jgi:Uma2 family endonuclease
MSQQTPIINLPITAALMLNTQALSLTDEEFEQLCRDNPDLRIELTAKGDLILMPPTSPDSGWRNSNLNYQISHWARTDGTGVVFDSSTLFTLPNGAKRSPDVSWIRRARWDALTEKQKQSFARICPDFVLELRSPTDTLAALQEKMLEYLSNGAELGLLIDPQTKLVHLYRPNQPVEILNDPETVSGDPVLPGFQLNVREIW